MLVACLQSPSPSEPPPNASLEWCIYTRSDQELNKSIIYLSQMLITERTIAGYDVPDISPDLVNSNKEERKQFQVDVEIEYKYRTSLYIYEAMKKAKENGCIMATHQFE